MSETDGTRTICIPSLAFNYVNNRLESIGYQGELYVRELGIPAELDYIEGKSRWFELFGTPERAARTLARMCAIGDGSCAGCPMYKANVEHCERDYTHLKSIVEWLRGDAE
jgi:hypothetical protein